MADDQPDILAIFTECLARDSDEERSTYLDEACQDDPQLRGRVEALLRAHSAAGNFLGGQSPVAAATIDLPPITEKPGTMVGPYMYCGLKTFRVTGFGEEPLRPLGVICIKGDIGIMADDTLSH